MASQLGNRGTGPRLPARLVGSAAAPALGAVLCLLGLLSPGHGQASPATALVGRPCSASSRAADPGSGQGVHVLVAQFAARRPGSDKFLPRLSQRYASELRRLLRAGPASPSPVVPHTVVSLPCVIPDQATALAMAESWHADLVIWGLVGVESVLPLEPLVPRPSPTGPANTTVSTSSVQVAGGVVSQGYSQTCIGNINNCHLYVLQIPRHPLESAVVPIVTSRGPNIMEDWDHNDSIKNILDSARSRTDILSTAQLFLIKLKIAEYLYSQANYPLAAQYAQLPSEGAAEPVPASLRATAARILGLSLSEQRAAEGAILGVLESCPSPDAPQLACRGPLWLAIARLRQRQGTLGGVVAALESALRHGREAEDRRFLGQVHAELGWAQQQRYHLNHALQNYRRALEFFTAINSPHEEAVTRNDMALLLGMLGQDEEAEAQLHRSILVHQAREYPIAEAISRYNMASLFRKQGKLHDAITQFELAADTYAKAQPPDYEEAVASLTQALLLVRSQSNAEKHRQLILAQQRLVTLQARVR